MLFKEVTDFKVLKPSQIAEQRIQFPFEGQLETVEIEVQSDSIDKLQYRLTIDKEKDSLYYWYKPKVEIDSASFLVKSESFTETFKYKFKSAEKDSLVISPLKRGGINFTDVLDVQELQLKFMINKINAIQQYFMQTSTINYLTN